MREMRPGSRPGLRRMAEIRCIGRAASPGVAIGTLYVLQAVAEGDRSAGTPEQERAALAEAINGAKAALAELISAGEGGEAAEILSFQLAMLEDEALTAPAQAGIAGGLSADCAWRKALDTEIA